MADPKKRERQRKCLHCALDGPQSSMRLVRGAGWLHEPIEGCIEATRKAAAVVKPHHLPFRTEGARQYENDQRRPKAFLDADEDAYKIADP